MFIQDANLKPNTPLTYGNKPQYLILHHADMNGTVQEVDQVHKDENFAMIGYNYYVRKDGTIWRGRPELAIGANCYNYNAKSISICAEGDFMVDTMPEVQKQAIAILAKYIQAEYNNTLIIKAHKELYNTDCPGANYPLDYIKSGKIDTLVITPQTYESTKIEEENEMVDFTADQKVLQAKFIVPDTNNIVPNGDNITPFNGFGWVETLKTDGRLIVHFSRVTSLEITSNGQLILHHCGQSRNI